MDPILVVLRLVVPLSILRFPLVGGLLSIFLDGLDWHVHFFYSQNLHQNYFQIDKLLDLYYLSIEAWAVLRWKHGFAKQMGLSLFVYRIYGVIFFELTQISAFLFFFPNVFEDFFLFYMGGRMIFRHEPKLSPWWLGFTATIFFLLKLIQEYRMHLLLLWEWRFAPVSFFSPWIVFQYDNIIHQFLIGLVLTVIVWSVNHHK